MHKRIVSARKKVDDARAAFKLILKDVQKSCRHQNVAECPSHDGWLGYSKRRRICEDCGREEEAWHWPGYCYNLVEGENDSEFNHPTKLNTERLRHVSREEFWKLRP